MALLGLKLLLVPAFLLFISLSSRWWGPAVAGRIAGLPVVAGPIVWLVAMEQGPAFAAAAASAALASVFASVSFYLAYTHATLRLHRGWPTALAVAFAAWFGAAYLLSLLPAYAWLATLVAVATLIVGPALFPDIALPSAPRAITSVDLGLRMTAGAVLTLLVTAFAARVGPRWSGLFAVFPVLGSVLAVFSHRAQGAAFAATLLRGMTTGLYSLATFFCVLAFAMPLGVTPAFALAIAAALVAQATTRRLTASRPATSRA